MATEPVPNRILDGRLRDQRRNEGVQPYPMLTKDVPLNNAAQTNLFESDVLFEGVKFSTCLLYTSPSPRDYAASRMPSSA